jgi:hypothetical protein
MAGAKRPASILVLLVSFTLTLNATPSEDGLTRTMLNCPA